MRRFAKACVALALAAGALPFAGASAAIPLPKDDPFYTAPDPIPALPLGTVIRSRPIKITAANVPLPFKAWHMMYVSTDAHDQPSVAVATVILPLTPSAISPRPLVSYQTAEDSLDMHCAPSYTMRLGTEKEEIPLPFLLAHGWAVVVSDYEGLDSVYTVGIQAAHGVLDGIRAAVNFSPAGLAGLDTPVGLWGYSGGGHASAWAAEFAPTYAPELNIVGVAAGGVPPDIAGVAHKLDGTVWSGIELGGAVAMSRAYPELQTLMNAAGKAMAEDIGTMCIGEYLVPYSFEHLEDYLTEPNALSLPWVQDILELNHLGHRTPAGPMYIFHAIDDELIPMGAVTDLVAKYCAAGVTVQYYQDPASEHSSLAFSGGPTAIAYLAARFAEQPAPNTCGLPRVPPGPLSGPEPVPPVL
jgi:hypothetical protein